MNNVRAKEKKKKSFRPKIVIIFQKLVARPSSGGGAARAGARREVGIDVTRASQSRATSPFEI